MREGELADALYLIREGRVAAYKAEDGKEQGKLLGEMEQTQFFGESALEGKGEVRQATVVSASPVKMLKLSQKNFNELFGNLAEILKGPVSHMAEQTSKQMSETAKAFRVATLEDKDAHKPIHEKGGGKAFSANVKKQLVKQPAGPGAANAQDIVDKLGKGKGKKKPLLEDGQGQLPGRRQV